MWPVHSDSDAEMSEDQVEAEVLEESAALDIAETDMAEAGASEVDSDSEDEVVGAARAVIAAEVRLSSFKFFIPLIVAFRTLRDLLNLNLHGVRPTP